MTKNRSGVGQFTKRITEALLKLDQKNHYHIFGFFPRHMEPPISRAKHHNLFYKAFWMLPAKVFYGLSTYFFAPPVDLLLRGRADVMFFPNFETMPSFFQTPKVVVVHDISFLTHQNLVMPRNVYRFKRNVRRSLRQAKKVITVSEHSKKEIVDHYKIHPDKVEVVYNGVDTSVFKPASTQEIAAITRKYKIKGSYLLFVGDIQPRKNIEGLLHAYRLLPAEIKDKYCLVLAGSKGWRDGAIHEAIERFQKEGNKIQPLGYVPDEDLPALYSGAEVFVYPSLYEGFGVPIIESMACHTPVITSNISSIPEIAQEAAILVDPHDVRQLSEAIEKVLKDKDLQQDLIEKGQRNIERFNWDRSAQKLLDIFHEVAERR